MNWVDRRFARERNFAQAVDVWNSIVAAVHNAVESFNGEEKYGHAEVFSQNGHLLRVDVEQVHESTHVHLADPTRRVSIAFNNNQPAITVSLDAEPSITFHIEADENHCFVTHKGTEISPDDFSKLALERAFFKPKSFPPARHLPRSPRRGRSSTAWS